MAARLAHLRGRFATIWKSWAVRIAVVAVALIAGSMVLSVHRVADNVLRIQTDMNSLFVLERRMELMLDGVAADPVIVAVRPTADQIAQIRSLTVTESVGTASFKRATLELGDRRTVVNVAQVDREMLELLGLKAGIVEPPYLVFAAGSHLSDGAPEFVRLDGESVRVARPDTEWPGYLIGRERTPVGIWMVTGLPSQGPKSALIRLKPGVGRSEAVAQLSDGSRYDWRLELPLDDERKHSEILAQWLGWTAFLALALCAVGVLVTEWHRTQQSEHSNRIRVALGARPIQVAIEHWLEFFIVLLCALVLATPVCMGLSGPIGMLVASLVSTDGEVLAHFGMEWLLALTVCSAAALLIAFIPVLIVGFRIQADAGPRGRLVHSSFARRSQASVSVLLIASCFLLLAVGGNALFSLQALRSPALGYDASRVVALGFSLPSDLSRAARIAKLDELLRVASSWPQLESAAIATSVPWKAALPGHLSGQTDQVVMEISVSDSYFSTLGIPVHRKTEVQSSSSPNAVKQFVVSAAARRALELASESTDLLGGLQVGVAGDVARDPFGARPLNAIYSGLAHGEGPAFYLIARGASRAIAARALEQNMASLSTDLMLEKLTSPDDEWIGMASRVRLLAAVGSGLALLAALLVLTNMHALMGLVLADRRDELFVRYSCGASPIALGVTIARTSAQLVAWGILCGAAAAFLALSLVEASVVSLHPMPLSWYVACGLLLTCGAAVASAPAVQRASRATGTRGL